MSEFPYLYPSLKLLYYRANLITANDIEALR